MSDLISREHMKSLGATCIASRSKDGTLFPIVAIDELPPAQPDVHDTDVGDLISRQAAIDALDKRFDSVPMEQTTEILMLRKDLRELPSSQPRKGKWIYGEHESAMCDGYRCDKCGFFVPWDYQHKFIDFIKDYNYCPSCGADMRGENE